MIANVATTDPKYLNQFCSNFTSLPFPFQQEGGLSRVNKNKGNFLLSVFRKRGEHGRAGIIKA